MTLTERTSETLRALLAPEAPALDLAILRVTLAAVLAFSTSVATATDWAALPVAARTIPEGVGWLVPHLRIDVGTVASVRVVFDVACVLGGLGLFTRASWITLVVAAAYLLLVPQLGGAVFHDHHLLWLAVIVAASPAGDALSVDAWWAKRRGRPPPSGGRAHGLAVRLAWLVIGLVFFFPGVHKLAEAGLGWALSDNLRNQMWWKWAQDPSLLPAWRVDRSPWVLRSLGLATIGFELGFLPLVLWPRTRPIAVLAACLFHAGAQYFMGIQFSALWATYLMFVPWQALLDRVRGPRPPQATPRSAASSPERHARGPMVALVLAAAPLFAGIVVFGARGQMQGYPFACYPTFQWPAADTMPALELVAIDETGRERVLERSLFQDPGPRGWAMSWRLAGVYGPFDRRALAAYLNDRTERAPLAGALDDATAVRASLVRIDVDPDGAHEVRARTELAVLRAADGGAFE